MKFTVYAQKTITNIEDYTLEIEADSAEEAIGIARALPDDYEEEACDGGMIEDTNSAVAVPAEVSNVKWYRKDQWEVE